MAVLAAESVDGLFEQATNAKRREHAMRDNQARERIDASKL